MFHRGPSKAPTQQEWYLLPWSLDVHTSLPCQKYLFWWVCKNSLEISFTITHQPLLILALTLVLEISGSSHFVKTPFYLFIFSCHIIEKIMSAKQQSHFFSLLKKKTKQKIFHILVKFLWFCLQDFGYQWKHQTDMVGSKFLCEIEEQLMK